MPKGKDPSSGSAQTGIVTAVNAKAYRVQVRLSLLSFETEWIRVASSYVGSGWGMVAMPHVGDEVLVQFFNDDLNDGVVTHVLYSEGADYPPEAEEQVALFHESGSKFILKNNGDIILEAKKNLYLLGSEVHFNNDR